MNDCLIYNDLLSLDSDKSVPSKGTLRYRNGGRGRIHILFVYSSYLVLQYLQVQKCVHTKRLYVKVLLLHLRITSYEFGPFSTYDVLAHVYWQPRLYMTTATPLLAPSFVLRAHSLADSSISYHFMCTCIIVYYCKTKSHATAAATTARTTAAQVYYIWRFLFFFPRRGVAMRRISDITSDISSTLIAHQNSHLCVYKDQPRTGSKQTANF